MVNSYAFPVSLRQRVYLAAASLAFSSLALSCLPVPAQAQKAASKPDFAQTLPSAETDYALGAGDRLRIDVFQVAEFSREYLVLVDGTVGFPLIGTIKVEGLSTAQLSELLTRRYAAFIKRPLVTVGLLAPRPVRIAVAGEVNTPGSYTLAIEQGQKFPAVTDIIEKAGGLTAMADVAQVQVRRLLQGKQQVVTLNLWELYYKGDQSQNITLRDGDAIVVPTASEINAFNVAQLADANFGINANQEINVAIVGEVYRPGAYKLIPEYSNTVTNIGSVRRQPPTITRAIQTAGGIKPLADVRQIQVRRLTRTGEVQAIDIDLWNLLQEGGIQQDLVLAEGDTIIIPTAKDLPPDESQILASASFAPQKIRVTVIGEVLRPGVIEVPPNIPLNQALTSAGSFDQRRADQGSVELVRLNPNGTVTKREIPIDFDRGVAEENNPSLRDQDVIIVRRNGLAATTDFLSTLFSPLGAILSPASSSAGLVRVITGN
jgi:polysaccharide export outer membrane protein